ncbi:uncharacterized protein LOC6646570 [Drosophila willistoni]|uniref:uncharacterized protein LOC6646570 n=1 Tax=Drosophila willistoni TaxID=7260 RepID=UPI001F07E835|nr:uncharacterized protein LOC6646570 [Drosophila willistoni]
MVGYEELNKRHKTELKQRTSAWGKGNNKFKPKPYVPPQAADNAKPWHHVRNDIIDDADEVNQQDKLNMQSSEAKKFLQTREENHRRNIIEAKRKEPTSWETFNEETRKETKKVPTAILNAERKDVKDLNFNDRNFFRSKLSRVASSKSRNLKSAINEMKRHGVLRGGTFKKHKDNK